MGKPLTFLFIVLGIWVYMEIQTQGTQGAFGGKLAWAFEPISPIRAEGEPPPSPLTHQVRDRVTNVMSEYERDRLRQTAE